MIKGGLGNNVRLTVPYVYIEPEILSKDGETDREVLKVMEDLWKNYNVNIRYLYVLPDGKEVDEEKLNHPLHRMLKTEVTHESKLLSHIQPDIIVCFFGRKEVLPSNYKVYSKDELINNYHLILSNLYQKDRHQIGTKQRFRRRRD